MADSVTLLKQSLSNIDAQIAALTAGMNPDYSLDGESVSLSAHLGMLLEKRQLLVAAIIQAEGPTELRLTGTT